MPFVDSQILPAALEGHYPHEVVQRWSDVIRGCDGLVFVTPEYNHGYPAVLKNAIDWLWDEWKSKPAGIVSYSSGPIGGARGTEQLKLVLSYVGLRVTQNHIHIGSAKGEMPEAAKEYSAKAMAGMLTEMEALLPTGPQAG
jgi:NAD(P)H-dependent FMN reductase